MQNDIVVYTTTNCTRCILTKRFLSQLGLSFREISIFREENAAEHLVHLTGTLTAPVVIVGDRFVRGYDPETLTALLQEEGYLFSE